LLKTEQEKQALLFEKKKQKLLSVCRGRIDGRTDYIFASLGIGVICGDRLEIPVKYQPSAAPSLLTRCHHCCSPPPGSLILNILLS
jgi:hypothetical protein